MSDCRFVSLLVVVIVTLIYIHGVATECPAKSAVTNGVVEYTDGLLVGSVATTVCNPGYKVKKVVSATCKAGGGGKDDFWTGTIAECIGAPCVALAAVNNGDVTYSDFQEIGSIATYTCAEGYNLVGNENRECTKNGNSNSWTGTDPTCPAVGKLGMVGNNIVVC